MGEITEQKEKQIAINNAVALVTRNKPSQVIIKIAAMLMENARLLAEVNRLKELVGEEKLHEFKIQ